MSSATSEHYKNLLEAHGHGAASDKERKKALKKLKKAKSGEEANAAQKEQAGVERLEKKKKKKGDRDDKNLISSGTQHANSRNLIGGAASSGGLDFSSVAGGNNNIKTNMTLNNSSSSGKRGSHNGDGVNNNNNSSSSSSSSSANQEVPDSNGDGGQKKTKKEKKDKKKKKEAQEDALPLRTVKKLYNSAGIEKALNITPGGLADYVATTLAVKQRDEEAAAASAKAKEAEQNEIKARAKKMMPQMPGADGDEDGFFCQDVRCFLCDADRIFCDYVGRVEFEYSSRSRLGVQLLFLGSSSSVSRAVFFWGQKRFQQDLSTHRTKCAFTAHP
uniref:Uncharacterized protein n=1 Tax=uncultured organism MedDCM-OCT-S08-C169 TaxID=743633 RepID=D6PJ56_9ZZZZ|nr:hypothetical protein [uncultured organism MedDCM-OCT-S08-C169]